LIFLLRLKLPHPATQLRAPLKHREVPSIPAALHDAQCGKVSTRSSHPQSVPVSQDVPLQKMFLWTSLLAK